MRKLIGLGIPFLLLGSALSAGPGSCPESTGLVVSHVLSPEQMAWFEEWSKPWHGKPMTEQGLHEFARALSEQLRRARLCMEGMCIAMERRQIDIRIAQAERDYEVTHRSMFQTGQAVDGKLRPWRAMLGRKSLIEQITHDRRKSYCLESV